MFILQSRRYRFEWILLGTMLLVLGALIGYWLNDERNQVEAGEQDRLQAQARVIEENLGRQLEGASKALAGVRDEFSLTADKSVAQAASRHLKAMSDAMPGVRTMLLVDAKGIVLASSRDEFIGLNASERGYFTAARERPDPDMLYVSPPFTTTLGVFSINVVRVVTGSSAEFAGIVSATLDPEYFNVVLSSVLYAPDMWVSIAHGDGIGFLYMPLNEQAAGIDLAKPGSFFTRHRDSGQTATIMTGSTYVTGEERMIAVRTIRPANVPMDKPLVVGVSRDLSAIYARWRRDALMDGALYAVIALTSILGLIFAQRRRMTHDLLKTSYETERRRTKDELSRSERHYRMLFNAIDEGFCIIEVIFDESEKPIDYRFLQVNSAFENQTGLVDAQGKRMRELVPKHEEYWFEIYAKIAVTGQPARFVNHAAQLHRWYDVYAFRVNQPENRHVAVLFRDITERRSTEEALRNSGKRLRELSRRLIEAEDGVRRTINRELHDRVGASLSALNLNLSILRSQLPQESLRAVGARFDDSQKLLEETTAHVRDLMADLHPPALDDYGLLAALRTYVRDLGARIAVPIGVQGEDLEPRLPLVAETALFRVAQGALANAVRHAQAKRIQVLLAESSDRVTLTIADNGTGFDVAHVALAHASWGLAIMRERAQAVGAELSVESTPGEGTRVRVEIQRERR